MKVPLPSALVNVPVTTEVRLPGDVAWVLVAA